MYTPSSSSSGSSSSGCKPRSSRRKDVPLQVRGFIPNGEGRLILARSSYFLTNIWIGGSN